MGKTILIICSLMVVFSGSTALAQGKGKGKNTGLDIPSEGVPACVISNGRAQEKNPHCAGGGESVVFGTDLVTGNTTPGSRNDSVSLLFGDNAGGFTISNRSTLRWNSHSIAVGDFDGDSLDDVSAVHYDGEVFIGLAANSFALTHTAQVTQLSNPFEGVAAGSTEVADLNGDGNLDLAIKSYRAISVFLGNGDGTFGPEAKYQTVFEPRSIDSGDLDGDGHLDLVAVGENGSGSIGVHYGDGTGYFTANGTDFIGGGAYPSGNVRIVDIDGDADLDVIAGSWVGDVQIYANDGAGTKSFTQIAITTGTGVQRLLLVADLDGNGSLDIVTSPSGSSLIEVRLNDGAGNFLAGPDIYAVGTSPVGALLGDFNADGIGDIATVNIASNDVSILLGAGGGIFNAATSVGPLPQWPQSIAVGNFD